METKRFVNIQALRGLAALLVLGRHMQICVERLMDWPQLTGVLSLGDIGVDLFFMISGFVLAVSTGTHLPTWRAAGVFLYHRASRIYPLYWLYTLPVIWVYGFHREWLHRVDKNEPISVIKSLLLWPQRGLPMLGQGWSLMYELYYYLVFAGMLLLPRRYFIKGVLLWALGVVAVNTWIVFGPGRVQMWPEGWLACNLQSVEFVAGALVGVAVQRSWLARVRSAAGWWSMGVAAAWMGGVLLPLGFQLLYGERIFGYGFPALALLYGAVALELNGVRLPSALGRVGTYSYSIYLSHILVLNAVVQVWPWHKMRGLMAEGGVELTMLCCALGVGAASYHLLERPLLRASRRWLARDGQTVGVPSLAPNLAGAGRNEVATTPS